jgi:hypothetical protein
VIKIVTLKSFVQHASGTFLWFRVFWSKNIRWRDILSTYIHTFMLAKCLPNFFIRKARNYKTHLGPLANVIKPFLRNYVAIGITSVKIIEKYAAGGVNYGQDVL